MSTRRASYEGVAVAVPVTVPYVRYSTPSAHWFLGQAVEADAGESQQDHIRHGFRRCRQVGALDKAHQVARQKEVHDIAAAIRHVAAKPDGAADDAIDLIGGLVLVEDGLVAREVQPRAISLNPPQIVGQAHRRRSLVGRLLENSALESGSRRVAGSGECDRHISPPRTWLASTGRVRMPLSIY